MRLEGQAKMGFYPTPENELEKIFNMINPQGTITAIDPCAGDGRALKWIKEHYENSITVGIELEKGKFEEYIKGKFDITYNADALNEIVSANGWADLLFLNPPYDDDVYSSVRLENLFLDRYTSVLAVGGLLIFIVPEKIIENSISNLILEYEPLVLYKFEDQIYNQWVFIGRKKGRKSLFSYKKDKPFKPADIKRFYYVKGYYYERLFGEFLPISKIELKGKGRKPKIKSLHIDREELKKKLTDDSFNEFAEIHDHLKAVSVEPITYPREGHLAVLLSAGLVNGQVDENTWVMGSVSYKSFSNTEEEINDDKIKTTTKITKIPVASMKVLEKTADGFELYTLE